MYSKQSWGGDVDPFILAKFIKTMPERDDDPLVSLVIFEWRDEDLVGVWPSDDAPEVGKPFISPATVPRLISDKFAERVHL